MITLQDVKENKELEALIKGNSLMKLDIQNMGIDTFQ